MPRTAGANEISDFMRGRIVGQWETGRSQRNIAASLNIPLSTINNVVCQFRRHGKCSVNPRSGRPKPTQRFLRNIRRSIEYNPRQPATEIAQEASVSVKTARRYLKKLGYSGRVAKRKPLLSATNIAKRLAWAREMSHKPNDFWQSVIFSDESSFQQFPSGGRTWVWRRPDQKFQNKRLQPTVKHSLGVLVWGAIWWNGRSDLIRCQGSVNSTAYCQILQEGLLPAYQVGGISRENSLFMQDGAPSHAARATKAWLEHKGISCLNWTAQSPDMNPIESVWFILDQAMRKRKDKPKSADSLFYALKEEWAAIPQAKITKLIQSMPERVSELLNAKGMSTKY